MNLKEIVDGLEAGSITIDHESHLTNSVKDRVVRYYERINDTVRDSKDKEVREWKSKELLRQLEHGEYLGLSGLECQCFDCGANLYIVLKDDNTLSLIPTHDYWDITDKGAARENISKYDYVIKPEEFPSCVAKPLRKKKKLVSEIEVPSGELIFQNYFNTKKLYVDPENEWGEPSINSVLGRDVLMQYLAKQNVGYGQMGNMSVSIHVKNDGSEIIVTTPYGYDGEKDEEYDVEFDGFKQMGSISLSVWRWQCADKKVLEEAGETIPEIDPKAKVDVYSDAVLAKVKTGKWRIEHYFDFFTRKDDEKRNPIYSKLTLIQ